MLDSSDDSPPTRAPYKGTEDHLIIEYICKNKVYNNVKGRVMWEQMSLELKSKNYHRSWHSLKERYRKYIIPNISSYELSDNKVNKLLKPYKKPAHRVKTGKPKSSGKKWVAYSRKEDKIIIKHVLEEEDYYVSGNFLWLMLERIKLLPGRSWQSLRGRFLNVILKNIDDLVDKETCDKIRKRVYGDSDFIVHTDEEDSPERVPSPKNQKKYLRLASPCRYDTVIKEKTLATRPCSGPVPSTSQMCSVRPPATSNPHSLDSDSDHISSSSSTVELSPTKAKRTKRSTIHSTDSELSEDPNPHSPSTSTNEEPMTKSACNISLSKVLMIELERCDPKTAETRVASSVSSNTTSQKTNSVDSTNFNATTLRISKPMDCCCEDFGLPAGGMTPCGSACRTLQEASKKSPVRSSQPPPEQGRVSPLHKLSGWLFKPQDCRKNSSNSSEPIPENVGRVQAKTELQVSKPEQMVIPMKSDGKKSVFSDHDDDDSDNFNLCSADYVNNSCLCFEGEKCKVSVGRILFPVVHPWS